MTVLAPNLLVVVVVLVLAAHVRVAWWGLSRYGATFPWVTALASTAVVAAVAALTRGPASADELLFTRSANAWLEAAVLTALVTLPVFGFASRSVQKRWERHPGVPSLRDWLAGVVAGIMGLFLVVSVVIVLGVLVWR